MRCTESLYVCVYAYDECLHVVCMHGQIRLMRCSWMDSCKLVTCWTQCFSPPIAMWYGTETKKCTRSSISKQLRFQSPSKSQNITLNLDPGHLEACTYVLRSRRNLRSRCFLPIHHTDLAKIQHVFECFWWRLACPVTRGAYLTEESKEKTRN